MEKIQGETMLLVPRELLQDALDKLEAYKAHTKGEYPGGPLLQSLLSELRALLSVNAAAGVEKIYTKSDAEALCEIAIAGYKKAQQISAERPSVAESSVEKIDWTTWEARCSVLYQVIGSLSSFSGTFGTDDIEAALDVAAGRGDPENLLPWPRNIERFARVEKLVENGGVARRLVKTNTAKCVAVVEHNLGRRCFDLASYEVAGKKLCKRHASTKALLILLAARAQSQGTEEE